MHISLRKFVCTALIAFLPIFFVTSVSAVSLKGKTILVDGDSLARGAHATVNNSSYSYGHYLQSIGAEVDNVAVSGARMYYPGGGDYEMINHLTSSVQNKAYDYIVLQGGDNDIDHYSGIDNTYNAIVSYFRTVKNNSKWNKSKIFFIITPHMDRGSDTLGRANDLWKKVKKLCPKYRITCINFFKISNDDGNVVPSGFNYNLMSNRISYSQNATVEGSVDGSHPSQKAHIAMGKVIEKKLLVAAKKDEISSSSSSNGSSSGENSKYPNDDNSADIPVKKELDTTVDTVFFGSTSDTGDACGVFMIVNLIVDILSIGVGVLAAIGITVVGIKYLTARDSEEQTRKAKRRMLEIVIGLAIYAVLYAGLQFLLPGGKFSFDNGCSTTSEQDSQSANNK